jgi:hypothetical protein
MNFSNNCPVRRLLGRTGPKILISAHCASRSTALPLPGPHSCESGRQMTMGASYIIRVFVIRKVGFGAAGLYQSAWTLGGMYVGVILGSMGTDFYPCLTPAIQDNNTWTK